MAQPASDLEPRAGLERVPLANLDVGRVAQALDRESAARLEAACAALARRLQGRRLWHINSTAVGGGVAELLSWALPLVASEGVDVRWLVLTAPTDFFELTKRLHHLLHESERPFTEADRRAYDDQLAEVAEQVPSLIEAGDVVVVHDPQPAGLIPALARVGAHVIWRCHIGTDSPGRNVEKAQAELRRYVDAARVIVFSRDAFIWPGLPEKKVRVIRPAIDPCSAKNQPLAPATVEAILGTIGVRRGRAQARAEFQRLDGTRAEITRQAEVLQTAPAPPDAPLVTQVSRWDPLKDPLGVVEAFTNHVPRELGAHLVLAGPATAAVDDDPEGRKVLESVRQRWHDLEPEARERVHIVTLPMQDREENAAMVNALQRAATVVVQKSLREGFGLTVVEAMWKGRPVVATAVGGIQEQIQDGVSGLLLERPDDLSRFGDHVSSVLSDAELQRRLGEAAHARVTAEFLPDRLFADWAGALGAAADGRPG